MNNVLKKNLSVFLAITIIFSSAFVGLNEIDFGKTKFSSSFAVKSTAASASDLTFELESDGKSYYVSDCNKNASGSIVIPSTYNDKPVTRIGGWAFDKCTSLTSIEIPDSVTNLGNYAFTYCTSLTSIEIPDSVTTIVGGAFDNCTSLASIDIPDSVTSIGSWTFNYCSSLTEINVDKNNTAYLSVDGVLFNKDKTELVRHPEGKTSSEYIIPDSVKILGDYAFMDCASLTSITIPDGVKNIGRKAFCDCASLTSITIPDSVKFIDEEAFYNTGFYKKANNWEKNVLYIGNHLIEARKFLSGSYIIKPGTKTIAGNAFFGCSSLKSVEMSDGIVSIGSMAFYKCTSLKSITIPDSVEKIGMLLFSGCIALEKVNWNAKNVVSSAGYPDYLYNAGTTGNGIEIVFGDSVETIPALLCLVRNSSYSPKITKVIFGNSVTSIGDSAFSNCTNLTSIEIPDSVTSIGDSAFSNCTSLTSITIPDSVTSIGDSAFTKTGYYNDSNNWESDVLYIGNHLIKAKVSINGDYIIKSGTKTIVPVAFGNCKNLNSITIPDSVINIGSSTFRECNNLTSVTIGNSVTSIGEFVFKGCSRLVSVKIPDSVTNIGDSAFLYCNSLGSITIPKSVTSIGEDAFGGCSSLISINVAEDNDNYCSVDGVLFNKDKSTILQYPDGRKNISYSIPNTVINIATSAFDFNSNLVSIEIPDSVKNIEDKAFRACGKLESVKLSENLRSIGAFVFNGCLSIVTIEIPEGVDYIGNSAFGSCTGLKSIEIPASVTLIDTDAFLRCNSLSDVYYKGTARLWNEIEIRDGNECLLNAEIYCLCEHDNTIWITDKEATLNAAGSKHQECTDCGETLETAKIPQLKCSKPKLKSIENTEYGVLTKWSSVSGADKYRVYRKTSKSDWKCIGTTSKAYYTDKTAKSGTKYYYAVKAQNEAGNSSLSSSLSKYYLADTTLSTPKSTKSGITLKWSKITGADGYMVYRKTGSGSYSKIATVKGSTKVTYTDKSAKKGKTYTYKIKAYKSKTYSAYSNAKKIKDKY